MSTQEENDAISALTGLSLNHLLGGLSLPAGDGLANQLGISGIPALNSGQIYNDKWDEEDAVGLDQGKDWETEIDREMQDEDESDDAYVKQERHSPNGVQVKRRRVRIVKRLVERPRSVYERFPAFEKDKILDFSELFKGYTARKSRLAKRPFHGKFCRPSPCCYAAHFDLFAVETVYPRKKEVPKGFLDTVVGDTKRQVENKLVEDVVSSGSVELDLRRALEVCFQLLKDFGIKQFT
jgi:transcription initiation factor TFIID subunit 1, fungi type